jgi:hypothetical protein
MVTIIMASCNYRFPEQTVVTEKHLITEKNTIRYDPVIQQTQQKIIPGQYILVVSDSEGNRYQYHTGKVLFQKVNVGDSLFYNQETNTMKLIK